MEYTIEQSIAVQQLCSFTNIPSLQCQKIGITTSYSTLMNKIMYSNTHQLNHILKTTGCITLFFQILIEAAGQHHPQQLKNIKHARLLLTKRHTRATSVIAYYRRGFYLKEGNADSHCTKDMQLTQNEVLQPTDAASLRDHMGLKHPLTLLIP